MKGLLAAVIGGAIGAVATMLYQKHQEEQKPLAKAKRYINNKLEEAQELLKGNREEDDN